MSDANGRTSEKIGTSGRSKRPPVIGNRNRGAQARRKDKGGEIVGSRAFHCKRNFGCVPNAMCYWCLANDNDYPFTDPSRTALWRSTLSASPPWAGSSPSPFLKIPGGDADVFLAKDLFHLCHLGAVRTFAVNALCFLVSDNHFAPCMIYFDILGTFSSFFG